MLLFTPVTILALGVDVQQLFFAKRHLRELRPAWKFPWEEDTVTAHKKGFSWGARENRIRGTEWPQRRVKNLLWAEGRGGRGSSRGTRVWTRVPCPSGNQGTLQSQSCMLDPEGSWPRSPGFLLKRLPRSPRSASLCMQEVSGGP